MKQFSISSWENAFKSGEGIKIPRGGKSLGRKVGGKWEIGEHFLTEGGEASRSQQPGFGLKLPAIILIPPPSGNACTG